MKLRAVFYVLVAIAGSLAPGATAQAQDLRAEGRTLAKQYGESIVNIQIILTQQISYGGQNNEREVKVETCGTVISPDGLTIAPLSAVDPAQMVRQMMSSQGNNDVNFNSRVKDIKLIVNKKKEIPATVVLRDPDLNIALLRPNIKPTAPMKFLDLTNAAEPQMLDEVCVLARLGRVADREISVMTGEIQAIITKPRKYYVPSSELASGGYGVPIFNVGGKVIGVALMRTSPGGMEDAGGGMFGNPGQGGMLVVILPSRDIQEMAAQAPAEAPKGARLPEPPRPAGPRRVQKKMMK